MLIGTEAASAHSTLQLSAIPGQPGPRERLAKITVATTFPSRPPSGAKYRRPRHPIAEPAGTQATSTATNSQPPSKKQLSYSRKLLCNSATGSNASILPPSQWQRSTWESLRQIDSQSPGLPRSSARPTKSETLRVERSQTTGLNTWRPVSRPESYKKKPARRNGRNSWPT